MISIRSLVLHSLEPILSDPTSSACRFRIAPAYFTISVTLYDYFLVSFLERGILDFSLVHYHRRRLSLFAVLVKLFFLSVVHLWFFFNLVLGSNKKWPMDGRAHGAPTADADADDAGSTSEFDSPLSCYDRPILDFCQIPFLCQVWNLAIKA